MKKIDINSIILSPEWIIFKSQFIEAILSEFRGDISSSSKKRIRDFYGDVDSMLPLVTNLVEFNGTLVVPEAIRGDLEEWIPKIYKETLGTKNSGLRSIFFGLYSSIGVDICPYCNHTEINDAQYEIDHIMQKSTHKLYALNIYNLIPSCETCNGNKSIHSGFCNFYADEIYNDMTFKIGGNGNDFHNIDITISMETNTVISKKHKDFLLTPLYLRKGLGIYKDLIGYVKCHLFPERYRDFEGLLLHGGITNGKNSCYLSECVPIHKCKHSKFIMDISNNSNYDILKDL